MQASPVRSSPSPLRSLREDSQMELQGAGGWTPPPRQDGAPPPPPRTGGSPTSDDGRHSTMSSDAAEYSETTRLVHSSALSDDGMTPLIQPALSRRRRALQVARRVLSFMGAHWSKAAILGVIITLIVLVSVKGVGFFGDALAWFQRHNGWAGWGIFVGMYTLVVSLFLPGVVLILGAGFIFGFWRGLLAVWAGGAVGQALAFLLARYLFRGWVESTLRKKWAKWAIIDRAIEHDGWKLVLIMRFSPIIPYNLLNIAMATTSIPFWQFTLVSAVGIIFECSVFAYFGSMADNIHAIISGQGGPPPVFEWVFLGLSAVMCVAGALFVSYSIKQAVKRAASNMSVAELDALGLEGQDGGDGQEDDAMGARMHPSYPASLEREGFVGGAAGGGGGGLSGPIRMPGSPEFELRAVTVVGSLSGSPGGPALGGPGSSGAAGGGGAREKARLLGGGGSGSGSLLAVTAASGSGTLWEGLGSARGSAKASKAKISPKHSSSSLGGAGEAEGSVGERDLKATRRHPSIGSDVV